MPWYKEYKGKKVFWAKKGMKGKGKPTGRYLKLRIRKPEFWFVKRGITYSYKRISDAQAKKLGLEKKAKASKKRVKKKRSARSKRQATDVFGLFRGF